MTLDKAKSACLTIAVGLLLGLVVYQYGPAVWRLVPVGGGQITAVYIVHETGTAKPPSKELVELLAVAPGLGVSPIDIDILGPGKQPSAELKPILSAVGDRPLPVLVIQYSGGKLVVEALPPTPMELKRRLGK
jgi:hypothetical protein